MAMPRSASLRASTSLTPSPVMATTWPREPRASTMARFWWGTTRLNTAGLHQPGQLGPVLGQGRASTGWSAPAMPTWPAMAPTVRGWSPETTLTWTPSSANQATVRRRRRGPGRRSPPWPAAPAAGARSPSSGWAVEPAAGPAAPRRRSARPGGAARRGRRPAPGAPRGRRGGRRRGRRSWPRSTCGPRRTGPPPRAPAVRGRERPADGPQGRVGVGVGGGQGAERGLGRLLPAGPSSVTSSCGPGRRR